MKKVLIVSPHFPPINAPDMQRVRLALPHLRPLGWEPTVLAVEPELIEGDVREPRLEATYAADLRVVRVGGVKPGRTRWAGMGNLWWRCGRALRIAGDRLLGAERFDLVFFSTTLFSSFTLGPRWRERFGVPYVVDYQDPWVNDYYERTKTRPPGGRLRFALSQWTARRQEPRVLRDAAGVVAVSPAYPQALARAYPWFNASVARVIPFGASAADFEALRGYRPANPRIDFEDGQVHHVYAGRCGPDMVDALAILFRALAAYQAADPGRARRLRLHFIGTGYAPPPLGSDVVMPVARQAGVAALVREHRHRVPYFEALHYLRHAHALVAVGSNDPGYSASKLFPYLLARRPLLLIYHAKSPVLRLAQQVGAGMEFGFGNASQDDMLAGEISRRWFFERGCERVPDFDEAAFAPFTAKSVTAELAAMFDSAAATRDSMR